MVNTIRTYFQSEEMAEGRPFYIIITLLLLVTSGLTLFEASPALPVSHILLYGVLLAVHLFLHWLSGYVATQSGWRLVYLVGQGLLALTLVLISQGPGLALALFATLVAESLGQFGLTRLAVWSVIGYVLLTAVSIYALGGLLLLTDWASPIISTMFLIIVFMVLYRRQLDERQHSQELLAELEFTHHQLADYATQVEDLTLTAERQRMARELHDTLAQGVAGLILQLEAANANLENGHQAKAQSIIQQSMKRARSTLAEARAVIDDLRLQERPLSEAIQKQTDRFTQATGIPCYLTLALATDTAVPEQIADHTQRIVSECLSNVTRHAQASHVWLTLQQTVDSLVIEMRDDGIGFALDTAVGAGHYGVLGMRERTRLMDGTFDMKSEIGQGTQLSITLPLEAV